MSNLSVIKERLLVQIQERKEQVVNGLLILDSNSPCHVNAEVIAIGDAIKGVKVGDIVIIPRYAGLDIEVDKVNYKIISDFEVMVVIVDENRGKVT